MAALRTITCPECNAERTTKAGGGTRLRCDACGHVFFAPAPPADEPTSPPTSTVEPPAAATTPPAAPADDGVTVKRAKSVVVKRAPKKAAPANKPDTKGAAGSPEPAPPTKTPAARRAAPPRGPGGKFVKAAGTPSSGKSSTSAPPAVGTPQRRGGAGFYNHFVRGRRAS